MIREKQSPDSLPAQNLPPTNVQPSRKDLDPSGPEFPVMARAASVNRTHRVVRERALSLRSRRSRMRSLSVPLAVCAVFVIILCSAIWSLLAQYEPNPSGIPDASSQLLVIVLWFLPACAAILALVYLRRSRNDREITR